MKNHNFLIIFALIILNMKYMWMIIFMVLPLLAVVYIGWHVWVMLPFSAVWKSALIALGVCCFLLLFASVARKYDALPLPLAQTAYEIGTSSIMVMLYLVMIFLVLDLGRLIHLVPKAFLYHNGYTALGIFLFVFGIFLYGNLHYYNKVRVPLELKSAKPLPKDYKVVMASDLHLGYHNPRKELARWVDMINAEHPDFILIAGDIIDGSMRPLIEEQMAEEFHRLAAPVYACLGNHEYYAGHPEAQQFYKDAGIHLLIDEAEVIDSAIVIIGRDDRTNMRRKPVKDLVADASSLFALHSSPFTTISSLADIPIADKYGPSPGLPIISMNARGAAISVGIHSIMCPQDLASGEASSVSAPRANTSSQQLHQINKHTFAYEHWRQSTRDSG